MNATSPERCFNCAVHGITSPVYPPSLWCETCQAEVITITDIEQPPVLQMRLADYRLLLDLLTSRGEVSRLRRLHILSGWAGRTITRYEDITAAEAPAVLARAKEWAHGPAGV